MVNNELSFSNPSSVMAPLGRYSHLVSVPPGVRLLVLAGQTGHDREGHLPEDAATQWLNAMKNVLAILASAGGGPGSIIKLNTWVVAGHDVSGIRAEAAGLMQGAQPAATFAYVHGLFTPALKVELEAWAALPA